MSGDLKWYPAKNETGVVGRFEYLDLLDVQASLIADETVTRKIVVCRHKGAGSADDSVTKVKDWNQNQLIGRFPDAWKAFHGQEVKIDGTPLDKLGLNDQQTLNLTINGVSTVEALSELSDIGCQNLGFGYRKLRDVALEYLASGPAALPHNKIANGTDPTKRRGGRPRKTAEQAAA